jgi:DNA-binding transcriptional ArsR family regulator
MVVEEINEGLLEITGAEPKKVIVYGARSSGVNETPLDIAILRLLKESPKYPRMIAKILGVDEQKIYYHVRKLRKLGLIEEVSKSSVRGATAIMYQTKYDGYARLYTDIEVTRTETYTDIWVLRKFFSGFISDGILDAIIVVGSPEPHGPYRASARDGHYSAQLALLLGRIASPPDDFIVKLDVDVRVEGDYKRNMIVV